MKSKINKLIFCIFHIFSVNSCTGCNFRYALMSNLHMLVIFQEGNSIKVLPELKRKFKHMYDEIT